jgi:hypothetical protein
MHLNGLMRRLASIADLDSGTDAVPYCARFMIENAIVPFEKNYQGYHLDYHS